MKRRIFAFLLLITAILSSCDKSSGRSYTDSGNLPGTVDPPGNIPNDIFYCSFDNFYDFSSYVYNTEESVSHSYTVSPEHYVNLESIIPNNECTFVRIYYYDRYMLTYGSKENPQDGLNIRVFIYDPATTIDDFFVRPELFSPYYSIEDMKIDMESGTKPETTAYRVILDNYDMIYRTILREFIIILGDYCISVDYDSDVKYSSAQEALLASIFPDKGATTESVVEMLERIEALLPVKPEE